MAEHFLRATLPHAGRRAPRLKRFAERVEVQHAAGRVNALMGRQATSIAAFQVLRNLCGSCGKFDSDEQTSIITVSYN